MTTQRRLAAILAADVVGYGRLMQIDESGTLAALKTRRKGVLEPLVAKHKGRVFKIAGDGVLIEFASAVNAVKCAVDLQQEFAKANEDLPHDRRIVLRIGVHVGDVMVEGSDLYGDGVNIAARLEALADPGGIVVSDDIHRQVRNKLGNRFEDIGLQTLKNVSEPMRAYRLAGVVYEARSQTRGAPILEKPTVAILPFANMSGDQDLQYFSDGISEDIITELSRFKSLAVVARNTSFQFRGEAVDIAQAGRRLGARYIVEGSARRLGGRVRITAQLIDAATNKHLWAERFDRDATDLSSAQDDVVKAIVSSLAERVDNAEVLRRPRKELQNWGAYDYFLRAREGMTYGESWLPLEEDLRRAVALDPMIAEARSLLVYVLMEKYSNDGNTEHLEEAFELARSAIALNPTGSGPHVAMAFLSMYMGRPELAGDHINRAIELNPNNLNALIQRATWLTYCGRCEEAAAALSEEPAAGPSVLAIHREARATALFQLRRYQEVIEILGRSVKPDIALWSHAIAALCHAGNLDEARRQAAKLLTVWPGTTVARVARWSPYQQPAMREHLLDGLRKAGLPE